MYSAAIQRYFNEHIHLPYSFFQQPQRFIRHALKKKGAFMATAYNYVEPSEADNEDIIEYLATDFDVIAGNTAGRLCILMKLPEPTMPLHCKMIGCSIKQDGSNPIWRTIELTEQGTLLLCGWGEGHTHIMLRRNLLYTAVTRAKAKVILIGQKQAVFIAIHKCDVGQRNTVLADRIVAYYNRELSNQVT